MIIFDHVSKVYPNGTVGLDDVDLTIQDGEFVAIIGRSGAGKSTLLRSVNRMHQITSGTLTVNGTDVSTLSGKSLRRFRRGIGMVFQSFNLVTRTTVIKNVLSACVPDMPFWRVLLGAFRKADKIKALESLDKVGILDKAYIRADQLSGGQQQRVALAKIIAKSPDIILADEPTGNIDPEMSYEIVDLLNHINANGTTVVMVTHEHNLVRHFHHRVITIEQGAVVSDSEDTEALPDDYATIERDYASDASNAERAAAAAAAVQNIASSETVEDRVAKQKEDSISPFYVQPNSDADLEKFMATYGVDSDSSDDDVDYSKYLDAIEKKTGGDNR